MSLQTDDALSCLSGALWATPQTRIFFNTPEAPHALTSISSASGQINVDIINRLIEFGVLEPRPFRFRSLAAEMRYLKRQPFDQPVEWPTWVDPLGPMPSEEEGGAAEAMRRLLPELRKLNRYEARAYVIKASALRKVSQRMFGKKVKP